MVCRAADLLGFGLLTAVLVLSPWLFGAWEMWWFALFLVPLAMVVLLAGVRLVLRAPPVSPVPLARSPHLLWIAALPFLLYALVRTLQAPVPMDAGKAFQIHLSAWTVGLAVALGLSKQRQWLLWRILMVNLVLMAGYAFVNHAITGSSKVLWADGFEQYVGRMSGTYYCPSHFSGVMELLLAMGLAGLVSRGSHRRWLYGLVSAVALAAIVATKTRGGGLTVLVMCGALLVWGPGQYPPLARWSRRAVAASLLTLLLMAFMHVDTPFRQRFVTYFGTGDGALPLREQVRTVLRERLPQTSRGRMYGAAWRAWKTAPWTGIGMGMHAAFWPRFAATDDGDREYGIWPSITNEDFHSYEVHSDWLQLGEELGIIGLVLFLAAAVVMLHALLRCRRTTIRKGVSSRQRYSAVDPRHVPVLGALLAVVAMGFHSLGDFNLQMPATSWLLAALIAVPIGLCRRP